MRENYGRRRRKTLLRRLQVAWIIVAILATIVIIITGSKLLLADNKDSLKQDPDTIEDSNDISPLPEDKNEDPITGDTEQGDSNNEVLPDQNQENNENIPGTDTEDSSGTETLPGEENDDVTGEVEDNTGAITEGDDGESVEDTRKMIALTFDDGPHPTVTNRILDILEANGAKATFFVMGNRVQNYVDTVKRIVDLDCQIGNHTFSHKDLTKLSVSDIRYEVEHSNDNINEIVPVGEVVLRPPYGAKNDRVYETVKVPMITWSVDPEDWKSRDKDAVAKHILETAQDGDIVLMHDLYESTADAMEYVIPKLIEMGYELVTVDELFEAKGITLEAGIMYRNALGSTSTASGNK